MIYWDAKPPPYMPVKSVSVNLRIAGRSTILGGFATRTPIHPYHPCVVYLPTWMVDFYGKCIGKYTSPMDPMGYNWFFCFTNIVSLPPKKKEKENPLIASLPRPQASKNPLSPPHLKCQSLSGANRRCVTEGKMLGSVIKGTVTKNFR